jgi:hypothetical protein
MLNNEQFNVQYASDVPGTQFTTQFTCFTGTKAQQLTNKLACSAIAAKSAGTKSTNAASSTKVQILTQLLVQKHKY